MFYFMKNNQHQQQQWKEKKEKTTENVKQQEGKWKWKNTERFAIFVYVGNLFALNTEKTKKYK